MRNQSHIIETYRNADCERRLNLFLECPAFRKDFIDIESREKAYKTKKWGRSRFWRRIFPVLLKI